MSRAKVFPNVWNVVSHPAVDTVYIYRCEKVFRLSSGESVIPDMVLYGPIEWDWLVKLVQGRLEGRKREDMDLGVRVDV
jgi:hypothetical protein